jgi:SAM-dependent methyltransferase
MNHKKLDLLLVNVADMALKRRARKIIETIDIQENYVVLDAGCGDGYYLHLLYSMNPKAIFMGSDFDVKALESAEKNFKGNNVPVKRLKPKKGEKIDIKKLKPGVVHLVFGDLMDELPFKSSSFNKVVLGEVAEHLPNDVKGLKELNRVMKKNGVLVVTVPNHNYPLFWDPVNWVLEKITKRHVKNGFFSGLWFNHIRLYKPNEIVKVVKKAGYSVEKSEAMTFWCLPFNHHIVNLGARMLYGGKLGQSTVQSVSKYKTQSKKPLYIDVFYKTVSTIDKLNDKFPSSQNGVGIFVKARK